MNPLANLIALKLSAIWAKRLNPDRTPETIFKNA
jgi:hypothetical protein